MSLARRLAAAAMVPALAISLMACSPGIPTATFPAIGTTPQPPGDATAAARDQVLDALGQVGLQALDSARPYRPPEGAMLAAAPRTVLQATLPDDPARGFIVIYAFESPAAAAAAARDHAAYVSSGPGAVNYPHGTRFVIRVIGSSVVFFHWSAAVATDERTPLIEDALLGIGSGVPVPG